MLNIAILFPIISLQFAPPPPPTPPPPPPHTHTHTYPWVMEEADPFFRKFIQEGLRSNWDFGRKLALQVGVGFFFWGVGGWDQKTNFCQSVFVSYLYMLHPTHKYFFCGDQIVLLCLAAKGWKDFKFFGDLLYQVDLISFLVEEARPFSCLES